MIVRILKSSFTGGEWSPGLYGRTDMEQYYTACKRLENMIVHPYGGISNRAGTYFVGETTAGSKLVPFQFSVIQSYVLEFSHLQMRIIKDGGFVCYPVGHAQEGQIVVVATTYTTDDLKLFKYTQSADVIYITHRNHPVTKLSRTDHHVWTFTEIPWTAKIVAPTGFVRSAGTGADNRFIVTVVSTQGEESLPSNSADGSKGNTFTWNAVAGAEYYNIYKDEAFSGFYGWVGQANICSWKEVDAGIVPDSSKTPPSYVNPFTGVNKYPAVCSFYQQRLLMGRTNNQPQTFWGSVTGSFENMNNASPPRDDDSYEFTLNSNQMNEIRWFVSLNELLIGTSGAEWKMGAGGKTNAVTASSVQLSKQSQWGSSNLQPIVIGSTVIFVTASQRSVRDFLYDFSSDSFTGADLNILSGHLTESNKIVDWTYQQDPYSIIWMVRDDGILLGLTYYRDHKVFGWHKHNTDGKFKSIACIVTTYGESEVYFTVERVINGVTKYYIEKLMPRMKGNELKESFFVDCGLTYRGVPNDEMLGLEHLEGKAVSIFADGNVVAGLTVTGGKVTLPNEASIVHIGLPYQSIAQTLEFDFPTHDSSSAQDRKKYLVSVFYRLLNSRALKIGVNETNTVETPFRTDELYNEPTRLFTGVKESNINTYGESGSSITILNDEPVPMTLLSMMAKISTDA